MKPHELVDWACRIKSLYVVYQQFFEWSLQSNWSYQGFPVLGPLK